MAHTLVYYAICKKVHPSHRLTQRRFMKIGWIDRKRKREREREREREGERKREREIRPI